MIATVLDSNENNNNNGGKHQQQGPGHVQGQGPGQGLVRAMTFDSRSAASASAAGFCRTSGSGNNSRINNVFGTTVAAASSLSLSPLSLDDSNSSSSDDRFPSKPKLKRAATFAVSKSSGGVSALSAHTSAAAQSFRYDEVLFRR